MIPIYTNASLSIVAAVPGISGTLKLPMTGFVWSDTTLNIVIQICFNTTSQRPFGNDLLYSTPTGASRTFFQIHNDSIVRDGCTLTFPNGGNSQDFGPTSGRPNVTFRFHRPQRPLSGTVGTNTLLGGGIKNNGSGSVIYLANTNLTLNGTLNNDGAVKMDTSSLTINPLASWPTTDFLNNGTIDLSYAPAGSLRKSQIYFNANNWNNNVTFTPGIKSRVVFGGTLNQVLGGLNPTTFNDFRMEKVDSTRSITLNQPMTVTDTMVLNNGKIKHQLTKAFAPSGTC